MKNSLLSVSFLLSLALSLKAEASMQDAWRIYQSGDKNQYPQMVSELIEEKMYFSFAS